MFNINELYTSLESLNNFKSKGKVNNIVYFDFTYLDINYAYDIYINNNKIFVDFLVRDNYFIKKLRYKMIFDEKNKIFNIASGESIENIFKEILYFDTKFKEILSNIFKFNVSVVITNFNRETIIKKCLDSLKNQKNEEVNYEVIIIDDCSTDNSCNVIENYITKHNLYNFRLYKRPYNSGGPSLPRNDGIELASGEYIYIVDSDDSLNEFALRDGYRYAKLNNSDICLLKKVAKNRSGLASRMFRTGTIGKADFFENKVFYNPQCTCFFKNIFLQKNKILFNVEHNTIEDLIFISECFSNTDNISILSDKEYYFLSEYNGDNISINGGGGIIKSFSAFMTCLTYYIIARDSKKFSCFLNLLLESVNPWLNGRVNNKDKIIIIDTLSAMIDEKLIDFKYLLPKNIKIYFDIKEKKYSEFLILN